VKCVKYEKEKVFVWEWDINDRWNKYFQNLFNEGYEISPDSKRLDIIKKDRNYNYYVGFKKTT